MAKQIEVEQFVGGRRRRAPRRLTAPRVLERGRVCTRRCRALALAAGIALGAAATAARPHQLRRHLAPRALRRLAAVLLGACCPAVWPSYSEQALYLLYSADRERQLRASC